MPQLKQALKDHGITSANDLLKDPSVRSLTRDIIQLAKQRDPVKAVQDIALALAVLEIELDQFMKKHRA